MFDADPSIPDQYQVLPEVIAALFGHREVAQSLHEIRVKREREKEEVLREKLFSVVHHRPSTASSTSSSWGSFLRHDTSTETSLSPSSPLWQQGWKSILDTCVLHESTDTTVVSNGIVLPMTMSYDSEECEALRKMSLQSYFTHLLVSPHSSSLPSLKGEGEDSVKIEKEKKKVFEDLLTVSPSLSTTTTSNSASITPVETDSGGESVWKRLIVTCMLSMLTLLTLLMNIWTWKTFSVPFIVSDTVVVSESESVESITISSSLSICSDIVSDDITIVSEKKADSVDRDDYVMMNRSVIVHEEIVQEEVIHSSDESDSNVNEKDEKVLEGEIVGMAERDSDVASEDEDKDEEKDEVDIANDVTTAIESDAEQCDEDKTMEITENDEILCDLDAKDELAQNVPDDSKVRDLNANNGNEFFLVSLTDQDSPKSVK